VRDTDDLQTTIPLGPVNRDVQTLALELGLRMTLPMPDQDEHLPDRIEAWVHRASLEVQRRLFRALLEKADHELVLQRRHGKGGGIQRWGTRPSPSRPSSAKSPSNGPGSLTSARARWRSRRRSPGTYRTSWPSPGTSATLSAIRCTTDPRTRAAPTSAGTLETRTCWGGARSWRSCLRKVSGLIAAERERARALLEDAPEARLAVLGPSDPDAAAGLLDDDDAPPCDDPEEAQAEWERAQAERAATSFPGCEPMPPVAEEPRAVDPGSVIVEPDEVKTKAQPATGREEVLTFTAVVLVDGLQSAVAEATAEGLWFQVAALLLTLGVLRGERRMSVLGDRASWIRTWFEGLGVSHQAMIVCWYHLRKPCDEQLSAAGGP
jgi:hypothetical protein